MSIKQGPRFYSKEETQQATMGLGDAGRNQVDEQKKHIDNLLNVIESQNEELLELYRRLYKHV